jgi:hypothetical protein
MGNIQKGRKVDTVSSGDTAFDNTIKKFFPPKKVFNPVKLKEVEERFGVPFNNGKTKMKMAFADEDKAIESISKLLKSGVQEFEI